MEIPDLDLAPGWTAEGPFFKDDEHYLSKDGANPDAPWPGYGWPLGTECWWYRLAGPRLHRLVVTGLTQEKAGRRAEEASRSADPLRFVGAVR